MFRHAGFLSCVLIAGCNPSSEQSYTGRLRIDSGTEYAALEEPSPIGGACSGWNALEIRRPGQPGSGTVNVVGWRREGTDIALTSRDGSQRSSGPAAIWRD